MVAAKALSFEDGLSLVHQRALAMQAACDEIPGTMAAVLGLEDQVIEEVCAKTEGIVVAANYNCQGQLVISGEKQAIATAGSLKAKEHACFTPSVGGAFHPQWSLKTNCRCNRKYLHRIPHLSDLQNVPASGVTDAETIKSNLIAHPRLL